MASPNDSPNHHYEGSSPPQRGKEKKRVGFSEGKTTPLHEELQSRPGSSSSSVMHVPDMPSNRSSRDGVDHHELTRALSRILSNDDEDDESGRVVPGISFVGQASSALGGSVEEATSGRTALAEPAPSYYPPTRQMQQEKSEKAARERAHRLAQSVERDTSDVESPTQSLGGESDDARQGVLAAFRRRRRRSSAANWDDDGDRERGDDDRDRDEEEQPQVDPHMAALQLVQSHARGGASRPSVLPHEMTQDSDFHYDAAIAGESGQSGYSTPANMYENDGHEYVPPPSKYNGGILSSLLRLYQNSAASGSNSAVNSEKSTPAGTPTPSRPPSPGASDGTMTPKRRSGFFGKMASGISLEADPSHPSKNKGQPWNVWHPNHRHNASTTSLSAGLLGTSSILASTGSADIGQAVTERVKRERPPLKRNRHSGNIFGAASPKLTDSHGGRRKRREEEQMRITVHIAQVLSRHRYLTTLCRALMMYGAPTHRLEDYLKMSARVLEIEAQFLYIPGCMLVSFDDSSTHTAEVKLVRAPQGVDLGKLSDVHTIYKKVIHDMIGVDEAINQLNDVMKRKVKFKRWLRVPLYGLASVCVAPFAFGGRFIDLPIAFVLGCIVGLLALVAAPSNAMYSNVFEISAAVLTSFLARAAGSIGGGKIFCFASLAQSSIALILPGYMVLCSSLELQSQNIVAGSVRMVYAMIYTLFLGYGITIGTAVYGAIDSNATSDTNCTNSLTRPWYFLFVPMFTICLCIINQAKWRQMPVMVLISVAGFAVNTYASSRFSSNAQIPSTLGAICVGVLANLYARTSRHFEVFFHTVWSKYLEPCICGVRIRRQHWRGLSSNAGSRWGSRDDVDGSKDNNGYYDMPAYGKDPTARAEEGNNPSAAAAAEAERKAPGSAEVMGYGLAAAAMLPAIFVQVPSGLAVNGSLLSGLNAANELTGNTTGTATTGNSSINNVSFTVLFSVIQVAIGITVGLFLSALIVYPLGKRRSALFSF